MGAGTMWRGIAHVAAAAGHPVMLYDVAENRHTGCDLIYWKASRRLFSEGGK